MDKLHVLALMRADGSAVLLQLPARLCLPARLTADAGAGCA